MKEVVDKKSPPWRKRSEQLLRPFRTWVTKESSIPVMRLAASDIEGFLQRRGTEIAPKTLNEELAIIKRFYRWAKNREYIYKEPTIAIERYKQTPKPIRIFKQEELVLIMKHATAYQRPFYQMLLYTGLRDGELRNLEWTDIEFDQRVLRVRIKDDWKPKTWRERVVPLSGEAYDLLMNRKREGTYVFITRNKRKWSPPRQPWVDLLDRIKEKEGVDLKGQVSLHTFRHTFATICLMQGVDIKTVSEFLGHTSVRMTEKYLHLIPEHKVQAMQKVDFNRLIGD